MAFDPQPFVLKLLFWPNHTPSQLIFLKSSTHFIGCFSILMISAKHNATNISNFALDLTFYGDCAYEPFTPNHDLYYSNDWHNRDFWHQN